MAAISLHAIGKSLAPYLPLQECAERGIGGRLAQLLIKDGFSSFAQSQDNVVKMAKVAMGDSLEKSGLTAAEIDAVIFSTESFWDTQQLSKDIPYGDRTFLLRDHLLGSFGKFGLINAIPYANWVLGCGNFGSTLAIAKSLVQVGQHSNVMVVFSDRLAPSSARVAANGSTVYSDNAVAFMVERRERGFSIEDVALHFSIEVLMTRDERDVRRHGEAIRMALRDFRAKMCLGADARLEDHKVFLADNMNTASLAFVCASLSIPMEAIWKPTKITGHSLAADCPLALTQIESDLVPGDRVGILNIGPANFGFISLKYQG